MQLEKTEKEVKDQIRDYLNKLKPDCTHFFYASYAGQPGVSDRICCYKGQFVAIEVKRPSRKTHKNGGLTDNQRAFGEAVKSAGGHFIVAYDEQDVIDYFQSYLIN